MTSADYTRDQRVIELRLERLEAAQHEVLAEVRALREDSIQRRAAWRTVAVISSIIGAGFATAAKLIAGILGG